MIEVIEVKNKASSVKTIEIKQPNNNTEAIKVTTSEQENSIEVTEDNLITKTSPSTKAEHVDGDFAISHDLSVGGMAKVEGGALVKGDLRVLGRLFANGSVTGDDETLKLVQELQEDVGVTQKDIEDIKNVLDELTYIKPVINSFSIDSPTREVGQTITSLTFSWSINKELKLSINDIGAVTGTSVTHTFDTPITSNKSFTLTATDGKTTITKTATLSFVTRMYWLVSSMEQIDNTTILTTQNNTSKLSKSRTMTQTFNCSGGKYIYRCIPTSLCSGKVEFSVNGLVTTFNLTQMTAFKNYYGKVVSMNVYRSMNLLNGSSIKVIVS